MPDPQGGIFAKLIIGVVKAATAIKRVVARKKNA